MQTKEKPTINREREDWRDEITDAAERLRMPMEHSFPYELIENKLYSQFGKTIEEVIENGIADLESKLALRPDLQFELKRRLLDREELEEIKKLEPSEKLVTILPIPDAVRNNKTTIDGYDRERMRALVRVSERTQDGRFVISCFSLDKSDYLGLQAAARSINHTIVDDLGSEEITKQRFHIKDEISSKDVIDTMRAAYDIHLGKTYGGLWYGGRPARSAQTALEFVLKQPDLVNHHMGVIQDLKSSLKGGELTLKLRDARHNFAAVLDDRYNNKPVDIHSFESSGSQARAEGRNLDGDCPTTATQAMQLGFKTENLKCVSCPFCSKIIDAKKTSRGIQCPDCLIERKRNGEIINHKRGVKRLAKTVVKKVVEKYSKNKEKYTFKSVIQVGGAMLQAFQNNKLVVEGRVAEKLKASVGQNE